MTENEAIKKLEYTKRNCGMPLQGDTWKPNAETIALDIAIKALEELQQYCSIGTVEQLKDMKKNYVEVLSDWRQYRKIGRVEECREAMEIQKKKKPNLVTPCKSVNYYQCPVCGELVSMNGNFCNRCGQALYWED